MQATKDAAIAAGELKYATGKPCRAGHFSPRYTSSGSCIECMNIIANKNKVKNIALKRIANSKGFSDSIEIFAGRFPIAIHPMLNRMQAIFQGNDTQLQAAIITTVNGHPVKWDRAAFLAAGVIFNGYHITNAHKFPIGTPFAIQIEGVWWPGAPLLACLRGEIVSIEPCNYKPTVEVQS